MIAIPGFDHYSKSDGSDDASGVEACAGLRRPIAVGGQHPAYRRAKVTWIASKRRTSQLTELKRLSIRSCAPMAHSAYSACMNQVQLIGGSITVCSRAVVGLPATRMHKGLSRCLNGDGSGFSTVVTSSVSQARAHQAAFLEWRQAWSVCQETQRGSCSQMHGSRRPSA